ncbi:hypothetical protein BO068_004966 [Escherichia coli]|nr:hypothetical protein [Salmonella enterica subsp. enterica serovar Java]EFG2885774.1 hypothetical protein [Escherichia coli]
MSKDVLNTPLETWHFVAFLTCLALLGVIGHVLRAVFNPLPDRLSDSDVMDMIVSSGYNWNDYLFGTEYDDSGFYRLDSWKNLRLAVVWSMIAGGAMYLFTDKEMARLFAWGANEAVAWFRDLLVYRIQNL